MDLNILSEKIIKKLSSKVLTKNEVLTFICDLIDYLNTNEYLTEITFGKNNEANTLAVYNFSKRKINVDLRKIISYEKKVFKSIEEFSEEDEILYINLCILKNIMHELVHSYQNLIIHETDTPLSNLFFLELLEADKDFETYQKYYYLLTFEREAIITSIENVIKLIDDYYQERSILMDYYVSYLDYNIRYGYKYDENTKIVTSPNEIVLKEYLNRPDLAFSSPDLYAKLRYGFNLSNEEYMNYMDNTRNIITKKLDLKS